MSGILPPRARRANACSTVSASWAILRPSLRSVGAGANWSGGVAIPDFTGDEPTIALGGSGRIYVTAVTGNSSSAMLWSDDDGSSWSAAEPIRAADGDIATPQAEGAQGMAILSGVSSANTVWFLRME